MIELSDSLLDTPNLEAELNDTHESNEDNSEHNSTSSSNADDSSTSNNSITASDCSESNSRTESVDQATQTNNPGPITDKDIIIDLSTFQCPIRRAKSMPNLTILELRPKENDQEEVKDLEDDTSNDEVSEIENDDDDETVMIHGYLEEQRAMLESKLGLTKLLTVYRLISDVEEAAEAEESVDYSTLAAILGEENKHLIDDIIQLVVADNFF